jgi:signal recognition particle receptor subunit beta
LEFYHLCWKKQVHLVEFPDQKRLPFLKETSEL